MIQCVMLSQFYTDHDFAVLSQPLFPHCLIQINFGYLYEIHFANCILYDTLTCTTPSHSHQHTKAAGL